MIIAHQSQWKFLAMAGQQKKLPHGLFFVGPEQVGKRTVALELAKFIFCQDKIQKNKPCHTCRSCQDIEKGIHADVVVLAPQEGKSEIQINQIRELIGRFSISSSLTLDRVAIIDRAHLMNSESQGALLKLLEEPRGNTIFILVSEYPELLLPTICSRVQRIRFSFVPEAEVKTYLLKKGMLKTKVDEYCSISFGRPGKVIELLNDEQKFKKEEQTIVDLGKLVDADLATRFQFAKKLIDENPENTQDFFQKLFSIWGLYLRQLLISKMQNQPIPMKISSRSLTSYPLQRIKTALQRLQATSRVLYTTNANLKLAFEIFLIEL